MDSLTRQYIEAAETPQLYETLEVCTELDGRYAVLLNGQMLTDCHYANSHTRTAEIGLVDIVGDLLLDADDHPLNTVVHGDIIIFKLDEKEHLIPKSSEEVTPEEKKFTIKEIAWYLQGCLLTQTPFPFGAADTDFKENQSLKYAIHELYDFEDGIEAVTLRRPRDDKKEPNEKAV